MSNAMISAVALLLGTVLHLGMSMVEIRGSDTSGWEWRGWLRPMGWAFLVTSGIFAVIAAA